jgi:hypothetical protein
VKIVSFDGKGKFTLLLSAAQHSIAGQQRQYCRFAYKKAKLTERRIRSAIPSGTNRFSWYIAYQITR